MMKIDKTSNKPLPNVTQAEARTRPQSARGQETNASAATSSTSVNLGATTVQLRNLTGTTDTGPTVNAAKVAEIKQAISEGRFQVNAGAVADSLIQSVSDLLGAQKVSR